MYITTRIALERINRDPHILTMSAWFAVVLSLNLSLPVSVAIGVGLLIGKRFLDYARELAWINNADDFVGLVVSIGTIVIVPGILVTGSAVFADKLLAVIVASLLAVFMYARMTDPPTDPTNSKQNNHRPTTHRPRNEE